MDGSIEWVFFFSGVVTFGGGGGSLLSAGEGFVTVAARFAFGGDVRYIYTSCKVVAWRGGVCLAVFGWLLGQSREG